MFVFKTNPWVYFVKTHECFFIHPISFSVLLHAKGNMIKATQEESWYAIRHNGYISCGTQKKRMGKSIGIPLDNGASYNSSSLQTITQDLKYFPLQTDSNILNLPPKLLSKIKQKQQQQKLSLKKFIRPSGITRAGTDKTLENRSISCVFTFVAQMV